MCLSSNLCDFKQTRLGLSVPGWSRKLKCGCLVTCVIFNRWGWGCLYLADPESWGVAVRFCDCSENSLDSLRISPERSPGFSILFSFLLSYNLPLQTLDDKYRMGICRICTQENIPELEKIYKLHCTMVEVLKNCCEISSARPGVELSSVNDSYVVLTWALLCVLRRISLMTYEKELSFTKEQSAHRERNHRVLTPPPPPTFL